MINIIHFLQSDWSCSGSPVLGKAPKQSHESLRDAAHILKTSETVATTSSSHTPIASATTTTLPYCGAEDRSTDKSETVNNTIRRPLHHDASGPHIPSTIFNFNNNTRLVESRSL